MKKLYSDLYRDRLSTDSLKRSIPICRSSKKGWLTSALAAAALILGNSISYAQTNIANYTFAKTTGNTYVPITGGTKVFPSGTGTTYDNEVSAAITLPTPFIFGGTTVTNIFISTNGFVTFGAAPSASNYAPLSTLDTGTLGAIAAFAQDAGVDPSVNTSASPEIRYQDLGTEFVIQYRDHANYFNRTTEKLNFQIHLVYATGEINFVYGSNTDPGTVSTSGTAPQVGIRGNSVTYATNVNNLLIGNIPAGTTCDWSKAVTGFANTSAMLFSGTTNVNVKIPSGLKYTWLPGTQLPVRTFGATTAVTGTGATVNWTAPAGATAYNVQYRVLGSCDWTNFSGNPVSASTVTLAGLTQNTTYQVQVQALNGSVQSIYSHIPNLAGTGNGYAAVGSFTTVANCASTVTGLASSALTPNAATISWTASTTAPANGYEYYYSTSSTTPTSTTTPSGSVGAGVVTANLTGLTPATLYYYWIRGNCNGTDKGVWSSSASFTTLSLCPTVTAPAANANGVSVTPTITWTAINGVTGYKLKVGTTSGGNNILDSDLGNVTSYTFTSTLNPSTVYYYSVTGYTPSTAAPATPCTVRVFTTLCNSGALNVPYTQDFENAVIPGLPTCTTSENAGTGNNWATKLNNGYGFTTQALVYTYNTTNAANAWFYTQEINLVAGTQYTITYKYGGTGTSFAEKLKVAYGTAANSASMINPIANYANIVNATPLTESINFTPATSGVYYFGFNAYSDANKFYLAIDDISINTGTLATVENNTIKSNSIQVYPNPFTDVLNISDIKNVKSIAIVDVAGRLVKTFDKPATTLQLSDLNAGLYMVVLNMNDGSKKTIKAIKK